MTLALALYLFQNDSGLRGNNGLSGLQNLPGLGGVSQDLISIWFFWASAFALALGYLTLDWVVSGKFGSVIRAIRDDEAGVWISESDIIGLHIETATLDEFEEVLADVAADLIVANHLSKKDLAERLLADLIPTIVWERPVPQSAA